MNGLSDLQLQGPNLWLPRWKTFSMEIVDWLSEKLQIGWSIHWFMLHNFNGRFKNVFGLSITCAKSFDWWSETATIFHLWKSLPDVITGDQTLIFGYDIETKEKSSHWKIPASPLPKKAWQLCSRVKEMLLVFFLISRHCALWDVCKMQYKESNLKCGLRGAGSSNTIMHLLTQHCQLDSSWQNI
jgi:hypothetical protein